MDSALTALLNQASAWVAGGVAATRRGNRHPSIVPYETVRDRRPPDRRRGRQRPAVRAPVRGARARRAGRRRALRHQRRARRAPRRALERLLGGGVRARARRPLGRGAARGRRPRRADQRRRRGVRARRGAGHGADRGARRRRADPPAAARRRRAPADPARRRPRSTSTATRSGRWLRGLTFARRRGLGAPTRRRGRRGARWSTSPTACSRSPASGKLLLLFAAARAIDEGDLDPAEPLRRTPADEVADSGLWQDLGVDVLPAADVAALDRRPQRQPGHQRPPAAHRPRRRAAARAHRAARLRPRRPRPGSPAAAGQRHRRASSPASFASEMPPLVAGWLGRNADLSMVPAGLDLDPLAHAGRLRNKTGTDEGVRADAGRLAPRAAPSPTRCIANWSVASFHPHKGSDAA